MGWRAIKLYFWHAISHPSNQPRTPIYLSNQQSIIYFVIEAPTQLITLANQQSFISINKLSNHPKKKPILLYPFHSLSSQLLSAYHHLAIQIRIAVETENCTKQSTITSQSNQVTQKDQESTLEVLTIDSLSTIA